MITIVVTSSGQRSSFDPSKTTPTITKLAEEAGVQLTSSQLDQLTEQVSKKIRYQFQTEMPSSTVDQTISNVFAKYQQTLQRTVSTK